MPKIEPKRQLKAIMFTDIVGYSAMMGRDEDQTFDILRRNRQLHSEIISKYNGQLIKELGDGILCTFTTVTDAVDSALALQNGAKSISGLELKIGIHSGEIVVEENDVFGDGVNIASRIADDAQASQILISETVFDNIKNKKYHVSASKTKRLKNIDNPVKIYLLGPEELTGTFKVKKWYYGVFFIAVILATWFYLRNSSPQPQDKKSIAVIPFRNISNLSDNEYFADGITGAIHGNLTKIKAIKVVSAQSSKQFRETNLSSLEIAKSLDVQYLLLGSAQRSEEEVQIRIELVDAINDKSLWSEVFTRKYENTFEIQRDISEGILSKLKATLTPEEKAQMEISPSGNAHAYDLYLLGLFQSRKLYDRAEYQSGIAYFKNSLEIDPSFAQAYAEMGQLYSMFAFFDNDNRNYYVDSAKQVVAKALELSPDLPEALNVKAYILRTFEWKWEEARALYLKALQKAPGNSVILRNYSLLLIALNETENAIQIAKRALSLDPYSPSIRENMGRIYAFAGDVEKADPYLMETDSNQWQIDKALQQHDTLRAANLIIKEMRNFQDEDSTISKAQTYLDEGNIKDFMIYTHPDSFYGYMIVGEYDRALDELEQAVDQKAVFTIYMGVNPLFDPIRGSLRFQQLLHRIGLSQYFHKD